MVPSQKDLDVKFYNKIEMGSMVSAHPNGTGRADF